MKKFLVMSLKIGGAVVVGVTLFAAGYDFIGLYFNSLKNHGWKKLKKGEPKPKIISKNYLEKAMEMAKDVLEDADAGWEFIME